MADEVKVNFFVMNIEDMVAEGEIYATFFPGKDRLAADLLRNGAPTVAKHSSIIIGSRIAT
ncbi:hypothetical protein [Paludibacterium purpuratum]|uniref:Uncharacterized protein n=1 Tax=Paludibacterium purpuratum TaxID=1144873 RepID=A0A4R7B2B2_9NEIS|nr:hypothetical protein [Paludibacterium purpuratum]TDR77869.1 hypothetical protein DFP86_109109 [Paludibacterium purpuratum]